MDRMNYEEAACFEHRFWLQVLGDHARFIKDSLSVDEAVELERAFCFITAFDGLLGRAREDLNTAQWVELSREAYGKAQEIRAFKLHLIERHLTGQIKMTLPPTFINHMVNEVEEYIRILGFLTAGAVPPCPEAVHLHLQWLLDAAGHSASINGFLDPVEKRLKSVSEEFTKSFEHFYIKAVEMAGYMRTQIHRFPALSRFNRQVELEMLLFTEFLRELEEMELKAESLSALSPLLADHMVREECYYLTKLSMVSEVHPPQCDPTKPRRE